MGATFVKVFFTIATVFLSIAIIVITTTQINMYKKTIVAYKNNQYKTVEGYVENYKAITNAKGGVTESFDINGIKFHYSDSVLVDGYYKTKSYGGVITGNNQHLKIRYIYYNEAYDNIILYIEELPSGSLHLPI